MRLGFLRVKSTHRDLLMNRWLEQKTAAHRFHLSRSNNKMSFNYHQGCWSLTHLGYGGGHNSTHLHLISIFRSWKIRAIRNDKTCVKLNYSTTSRPSFWWRTDETRRRFNSEKSKCRRNREKNSRKIATYSIGTWNRHLSRMQPILRRGDSFRPRPISTVASNLLIWSISSTASSTMRRRSSQRSSFTSRFHSKLWINNVI